MAAAYRSAVMDMLVMTMKRRSISSRFVRTADILKVVANGGFEPTVTNAARRLKGLPWQDVENHLQKYRALLRG